MNKLILIGLCFLSLLLLTACWDAEELTDRGFILGHGLDLDKDQIVVTSQVYRPTVSSSQGQISVNGSGGNEASYTNIKTTGKSVFDAIRHVPLYIGRMTNSSHLRIILISEDLVRQKNLGDILEVFYRKNDIRITSPVMITKGKAADYFELKPLMEKTISEQIFASQMHSAHTSQNTVDTNLLRLAQQMKSEVGNSILPYVNIKQDHDRLTPGVYGVALFKKGKMIGKLPPEKVEKLNILLNKYQDGVVEVPCQTQPRKEESFEINSLKTVMKPILKKDSLQVNTSVKMEVILEELACSKSLKPEEENELEKRIEQKVKKNLKETIAILQAKKFDAINLGNKVYAKDANLWRKWRKDWDQRFANAHFTFDVQVRIISSGTATGKHFFSK
jgi:spore germination protein KC